MPLDAYRPFGPPVSGYGASRRNPLFHPVLGPSGASGQCGRWNGEASFKTAPFDRSGCPFRGGTEGGTRRDLPTRMARLSKGRRGPANGSMKRKTPRLRGFATVPLCTA